jgi:HSP20 family protein
MARQGVLEVRIPKPEQRKPKKVAIQVGDAPKTIGAHAAEGGGPA